MSLINNEKGMAVPLVIIIMVVFMLLGTAMIGFSKTEALQVARDEKRMQAHYVARSGADATASWLIENYFDTSELDLPLSGSGSFETGSFNIDMDKLDSGLVKIVSEGIVGDVKDTVTLTLSQQGLFDNAIFGTAFVTLKGEVTVEGDIESNGVITYIGGAYTVDGDTKPWSDSYYPPVVFPSNNSNVILNVKNGDVDQIISSTNLDKIDCKGTLEFILDGNMEVVVNEIDLKGCLIIKGNGNLVLYVKDFIIGGSGEVINEIGSPASFLVLLPPNGEINFGGTPNFEGVVYGPDSTASFSGNTRYFGSIIAGSVVNNGTPDVVYDENLKNLKPSDLPPVEGLFKGFNRRTWNKY